MKKKIFVLVLALVMVLQVGMVEGATDGERLKDLGLIQGDSDGYLNEYGLLTRAELATILCRINLVDEEAKAYSVDEGFSDVSAGSWYFGYVNYCKNKGWMNGVSATEFDPSGTVTEEMVATVLLRVLGYTPVWGQAVNAYAGFGHMNMSFQPDMIYRGEVFNYVFETLNLELKDGTQKLGESLGLDIDYDSAFIGYANDANFMSIYFDQEGLEFSVDGLTLENSLVLSDTNIMVKSGNMEYGPFTSEVGDHDYEGYNYSSTIGLIGEGMLLVLDRSNDKIIFNGDLPVIEGYTLESVSDKGLVYRADKKEGIYNCILTDFDGTILNGDDNTAYFLYLENNIMLMADAENGFVLYNTEDNSEFYRAVVGEYNMTNNGWLNMLQINENDLEIVLFNPETHEIKSTNLDKDGAASYGVVLANFSDDIIVNYYEEGTYWDRKVSKSIVLDDDLKIKGEYNFAVHSTVALGSAIITYIDGNYGLVDGTGNVIVDSEGVYIYVLDYESTIIVSEFKHNKSHNTIYDLDGNFIKSEVVDYGEEQVVNDTINLPNGYKIISSDYLYTLLDDNGQPLEGFTDVYLIFLPGADLIAKPGYTALEFYSYEGVFKFEIKEIWYVDTVKNQYLTYEDPTTGKGIVIDSEGNVIEENFYVLRYIKW